jgi:hypothetical protein
MADEKLNEPVLDDSQQASDYHAPQIEEVVSQDKLEREAAYAGAPAPSRIVG